MEYWSAGVLEVITPLLRYSIAPFCDEQELVHESITDYSQQFST